MARLHQSFQTTASRRKYILRGCLLRETETRGCITDRPDCKRKDQSSAGENEDAHIGRRVLLNIPNLLPCKRGYVDIEKAANETLTRVMKVGMSMGGGGMGHGEMSHSGNGGMGHRGMGMGGMQHLALWSIASHSDGRHLRPPTGQEVFAGLIVRKESIRRRSACHAPRSECG